MAVHSRARVGGCNTWVMFPNSEDLAKAVGTLLGCHPHHFIVQSDGSYSIFCSEMAVNCLREVFGGDPLFTPVIPDS